MPAMVATAVMAMGRRRRRPARIMESSADKPSSRKRCSASRSKIPFLATMPMIMIMPMKDATLNVVRVINKAKKPPDVESSAEARIAAGVEIVHGFLHGSDAGAEVHTFKTSGNLNQALQILPTNFRLAGIRGDGGQGAERGSVSSRA